MNLGRFKQSYRKANLKSLKKQSLLLIVVVFGISLTITCANTTNNTVLETGILEGKVTIGPLCPVEPCNLTQQQIAAVYEARKVIVYKKSLLSQIAKVQLNAVGEFSISLNSGQYIVDISDANGNDLPLDLSKRPRIGNALPQEAEIFVDQTTIVDFDIDTGIR